MPYPRNLPYPAAYRDHMQALYAVVILVGFHSIASFKGTEMILNVIKTKKC